MTVLRPQRPVKILFNLADCPSQFQLLKILCEESQNE